MVITGYTIYNIRHRFRGTWNSLTLLSKVPGVIICYGFSHPVPFKMGLVVMGPAYEIVVPGTSLSHNLSQDSLPRAACIDPYCMPQQRLFLVWGHDVIKVRLQWLAGKTHGENRSPCRQTARDKFITVTRYIWSMSIVNTKIIVTFNTRNIFVLIYADLWVFPGCQNNAESYKLDPRKQYCI